MNNLVIHFGAGNIGRGLIGHVSKINKVQLVFIDLNKELIDQINTKNQYTIITLPSNEKINISDCSGLVLGVDNPKIVEMITKASMITTSIGAKNLIGLVELIQQGLTKRNEIDKLSLACFENGYKASQNLYQQVIETNPELKDKLTYINVVVDRLVPNQRENQLDLLVEDFFSVWYSKQFHDSTWLFKNGSIEIKTNYDNFFNKKFYGVNGLHFCIGLLGWLHNKKYINETINDDLLKPIISQLVDELSVGISKLINLDLNQTKAYLEKNIERFSNKYLMDEIKRVCRNISQKFGKNERFIPVYEFLVNHDYKHQILDQIYSIGKKYMDSR
ncbi:mannitol dehydrogenase family protein [[Mycoplasma] imitans]|uniref:mannitol dehydrogenase family protein n=1 Tax=[Mycoplasma] imitans TaxID=29560 RepID=UPI0004837663|nr:hypothetical protein [[Mycoplasma] imitans]